MDVEVLKSEKNELDVQVDNSTIAELLRCVLNEQGVNLAVWRRDHPSKPAVMKIKTSNKTAKKAVGDAVDAVKKELDGLVKGIK